MKNTPFPPLTSRPGRLAPASSENIARGSAAGVAVLCLVQFVDVLGVTELLSAVPRMLAAVSAPASAASALLTGYAMCFGGLLMVGAWLGDRFGHRRVLLYGIAVFAAGSLCAALASSVAMLIAARCLQGASAAASVPASLRLLIAATPHQAARRAAMSGWSAAGAAAGASGFVLGGVLTQLLGWRAMFWLNLPLALAIAAGVLRVTPPSRLARRPALPLWAGALFGTGVAGLVVGASALEPPSRPALGLAATGAGAGLLAVVTWAGRRGRDPLIPAEALRHRALRAGTAAAFLNTATTSSAMAIATLELQRSQHLSPAACGLRLLPVSVGAIAGAALATPALRRWTPRAVIGLGLAAIAVADATLVALDHSGWLLAG
ncbi:MAG: MFS transporter, partial [Solirubrobacteraceae bacterium]